MLQGVDERTTFTAADGFAAVAATVLAGILYAVTLDDGLGIHDSAELALRGYQLGGTHATGAPLYTLVAHLIMPLFATPAAATAWLSAVTGALGAGVAALLLSRFSVSPAVCVAGALVYACLYPIWGNAVITELYAPSVLLAAGAMLAAINWYRGRRTATLAVTALLLGLAIGAHFANVLLIPPFVLLVLWVDGGRPARAAVFSLLIGLCIVIVAFGNVWLAQRVAPFSQYQPDSFDGLLRYMLGVEHGSLDSNASYYLHRMREHTGIFLRNFYFVGLLLSALGLIRLFRLSRTGAGFLAGVLLVYFGYFTLQGSGDYFLMVAPVYLVCTLWLALGAEELSARWLRGRAAALLPVLLLVVLVADQWEERRAAAYSYDIERDVAESFAMLPPEALVVARWSDFTALRYAQVVEGMRPDIDLILPAETRRQYAHGVVEHHAELVAASICTRPVVTNRVTEQMSVTYDVLELQGPQSWAQLLSKPDGGCRQAEADRGE